MGLRQISILLAAAKQIITNNMKHSPIDDLYNELFGEYPQKAGTALERLATMHIMRFVLKELWLTNISKVHIVEQT